MTTETARKMHPKWVAPSTAWTVQLTGLGHPRGLSKATKDSTEDKGSMAVIVDDGAVVTGAASAAAAPSEPQPLIPPEEEE
jgi:hypothetical protein